ISRLKVASSRVAADSSRENTMQKITSCLWFDTQAEEAVRVYVSLFKNSKICDIGYYGDHRPLPKGPGLTVRVPLDGQEFLALNGGPVFKFTEAISLMVNCETQDELDRMWEMLSEGGEEVECGWLKDKYGLSWQIVPAVIGKMLSDADPARSNRVMQAV